MLKDSADTDLIRGVDAVAAGKSFFSPAVAKVMLDDYVRHLAEKGIADRFDSLSEREREIFQLIAEGHSNKEIADLLFGQPRDGRNAPRAHPAEARRAQHGRTGALRRPARRHFLMVDFLRPAPLQ